MDGKHAHKKRIIIGSTGVLTGIVSKPELNGESVVVVEPKSILPTGRIAVKLTDGREISVKETSFLISKKSLGRQSWGKYLLIMGSPHHYCKGVFEIHERDMRDIPPCDRYLDWYFRVEHQ